MKRETKATKQGTGGQCKRRKGKTAVTHIGDLIEESKKHEQVFVVDSDSRKAARTYFSIYDRPDAIGSSVKNTIYTSECMQEAVANAYMKVHTRADPIRMANIVEDILLTDDLEVFRSKAKAILDGDDSLDIEKEFAGRCLSEAKLL